MLVDLFFLGLSPTLADAVVDPFLLRCFAVSELSSTHTPYPYP